jgi:serine phosphatase RsbU (regulator of sigma subunit)
VQDGQPFAAPTQGPPLALEKDPDYSEGSLRFRDPASLLPYTDGLTEAGCDASFFGIERVSAVLGQLDNPAE